MEACLRSVVSVAFSESCRLYSRPLRRHRARLGTTGPRQSTWRVASSRLSGGDTESEIPLSQEASISTSFEFSYWVEVQHLLKLSAPSFFHSFLAFSLTSVVFIFIGRIGALQLSIASLANSFFYLTGASIIAGLCMGVETIGGQAHGAGNARLVALTYVQGIALSLVACIVVSLIWSRAEWIFLLLGQNPEISRSAARYLQLMIPYLFIDALFLCQTKSLTSRGIVRPSMIACGCALALAPLLSWLLMFKTQLGMNGAPLTLGLTTFCMLSIQTLLARSHRLPLGPSSKWLKDCWKKLRKYLSVTLPGLATVCCEWWTYEIFTVLAGLVAHPELSLGLMGAADSVINIVFVVALSVAGGVIIRVSNFLGAGQKQAAIASAQTAVCAALFLETLGLVTVWKYAHQLSRIWFRDVAVAELFTSLLPLIGITEWGSGISFVLGAVLRACNRGKFEFLANFATYWFVGVPLGIILGFPFQLGVKGFWIGLAAASQLQFLILSIVVCRLDFDVEIERAQKLTIL